jgi:fibronectin type 3 domain-containing protein
MNKSLRQLGPVWQCRVAAYVLGLMTVLSFSSVQAGPWKFVAVGDTRNTVASPPINDVIVRELANQIVAQQAEFVLVPGDLAYSGSLANFQAWTNLMSPVYEAGIGVYPVMGNHDTSDVAAYLQVFGADLPDNGPAGEVKRTYAFGCDNALIVGLDNYVNLGRVNQTWLDDLLGANTMLHVFAFGHMPAFKANHADCLDDYSNERDAFWTSLKNARCRAYFCGHDHFYDHMRVGDGDSNLNNDVHQFIVGCGGAPFHTTYAYDGNNTTWAPSNVYHEVEYGYTVVLVDGPIVTMTFFHRTGPNTYAATSDVWTYSDSLAPASPTGLTAVAGVSQVSLSWTAATTATSYTIQRALSANGPWQMAASVVGTSYTDTAVLAGTTYFYLVSALNSFGESAAAGPVSATPFSLTPLPPTGLAAVGGNNQVTLSWTASAGASSYNVKRSDAPSGPYTIVGSPSGASYIDRTVVNGATYFYVVTALFGDHESEPSAYAGVTLPPAPPTGLTATAGDRQVTLAWAASATATSYNVKRSLSSNGPFTLVNSITTVSYTDMALSNGTTYYYVVTAVSASGESANSTYVIATPLSQPPPAPTGLAATTAAKKPQINLTWNLAAGATSYILKRGTLSGGPYTVLKSGITTGTCTDNKQLKSGVTYYYVVVAVNAAGQQSPNSNEAFAKAP